MVQFTKRQWLTLIVIGIADFCNAICVSLQAPFYPKEVSRFYISKWSLSLRKICFWTFGWSERYQKPCTNQTFIIDSNLLKMSKSYCLSKMNQVWDIKPKVCFGKYVLTINSEQNAYDVVLLNTWSTGLAKFNLTKPNSL